MLKVENQEHWNDNLTVIFYSVTADCLKLCSLRLRKLKSESQFGLIS